MVKQRKTPTAKQPIKPKPRPKQDATGSPRTTRASGRANPISGKGPRQASVSKPGQKPATGQPARKTVSSRIKALEKRVRAHANDAKGVRFEMDVRDYFEKQGWRCTSRVIKYGREIDIVGTREDGWNGKEYLLVECKNTSVTPGHVIAFMAKVHKFYSSLPTDIAGDRPEVKAVIAHTGTLPRDAADAAKASRPRIAFKRL